MSKDENTESRIETALRRLHQLSNAIGERPAQGDMMVDGDPVFKAEMESLRVENQLLRQELLEITASYNGLKQATDAASNRLDKTIANTSGMLEQ